MTLISTTLTPLKKPLHLCVILLLIADPMIKVSFSLEKALNFSGFKDIEVYKLDFPFAGLFPYLEKKLFGNLDKLKIKLKGMVLGDERKAIGYVVEELVEVNPNKGKAYMLMMLKLIRNAILLPFALGYAGKLKGNGLSLYFQAKA